MTESREPSKKPVSLRCRLNYADEETFVRKYASNVSRTGIFAKTRTPRAVGEQIQFEFSLADGAELLKGIGRVVRVRTEPSGAPLGMDVKFLKLDKKGKALVDRIVEYKAEQRAAASPAHEDSSTDTAGQPTEFHHFGAESDMIDQNRKTAKVNLDAIDSMLDEIAGSSTVKKKRVIRKRTSTAPAAPLDVSPTAADQDRKIEAAPAQKPEAAPAQKPEAAPAQKPEAAPAQKPEAAPATEASLIDNSKAVVASDDGPSREADAVVKAVALETPKPEESIPLDIFSQAVSLDKHLTPLKAPLMETRSEPLFGLPTVQPAAEAAASAVGKANETEEISLEAAGIEEVTEEEVGEEEVSEADLIEEREVEEYPQTLRHDIPMDTEITLHPSSNAPIEAKAGSASQGRVFQDAEPSRRIAGISGVDSGALSGLLSSSIPPTPTSSAPPPKEVLLPIFESSAGQVARSSIPPVDPNAVFYPGGAPVSTTPSQMPASVAQQSFFPDAAPRPSYIPSALMPSAAPQPYAPISSAPSVVPQSYVPNTPISSVAPHPYVSSSSAPSVVPQPYVPNTPLSSITPQPYVSNASFSSVPPVSFEAQRAFFPDSSPPPSFEAQRAFFPDSSPPSSLPFSPPSSVTPQPFSQDSSPSLSPVSPRTFFPDSSPPQAAAPQSFFPTSPIEAKGFMNAPSSFFQEPVSASSVPSVSPISYIPSSVPPSEVSTVPPRPSEAPVIAMAPDELKGILGEPMHEESVAIKSALIQEDELDALLSALEDNDGVVEVDEIEEIGETDIDELEVVEVEE